MSEIHAGTVEQISPSEHWIIAAIGLPEGRKHCGLLIGKDDVQIEYLGLTVAALLSRVREHVTCAVVPLNLLINAPLSLLSDSNGNRIKRCFECADLATRSTTSRRQRAEYEFRLCIATTELLNNTVRAASTSEIRLFEGYSSPHKPSMKSGRDTEVQHFWGAISVIASAENDAAPLTIVAKEVRHELTSPFDIAEMDDGIPPVIVIGENDQTKVYV